MEAVDPKVLAATILAEGLGDVKSNIGMITCSGDISEIKTKLQRGMEFYVALAKELNHILTEKAPEFAFKGDIEAQLADLSALKNTLLENAPLLLNNMKGGMPAGNGKGAPAHQAGPGRQMVTYKSQNGRQSQLSVFNPDVVSREHGYEAAMLANFAIEAAKQGNLAEAVRLTGKIDIVVRTQEMLDLGLPIANINQHMAGGFALGGVIGVALFYLGVSGLLLVPAGLTAGTAQYTANLATNATRSGLNTFTAGWVATNVPQPRAVDTAREVANNIQQLLESVITDRVAYSYIAIWMILCMLAAGIYARGLNMYLIPTRAKLEAELAAARSDVFQTVSLALENKQRTEVKTRRNRNLAELGINSTQDPATIFKNVSAQVVALHNDRIQRNKVVETKENTNTRRRKLALAVKLRSELGAQRPQPNPAGQGGGVSKAKRTKSRTTIKSHRGGSGLRGH
jgi:hypothetical protein